MSKENDVNIIKTRDDKTPIQFVDGDGKQKFKLCKDMDCPWLDADAEFGPEKLRPRIEPWLTALFQ
ncbi:MAG: fibronectin-binding protein (FBP), partial [Lentisphaerae bacterium]|nr:fibronectin-binding protein (FBP) [Lentisphaerota bacterium]